MFEKVSIIQLEHLKTSLYVIGIIAGLIFGIIGAATETHTKSNEFVNGRKIEKRKPNKWFYISIIGMIVASLITSSSYFIGNEIDKKKAITTSKENNEFRKSVMQEFEKSITGLQDLNSSSQTILSDLKVVSSKTSDIVQFTEQQKYPLQPLSIKLHLIISLSTKELFLKAPFFSGEFKKSKNGYINANLSKSDIEIADPKTKDFLLDYVSSISFDKFASWKNRTWLNTQENHSWLNLGDGKQVFFNASISGDKDSTVITMLMQIDNLKIYNADFLKIKGLKDLIDKYLICSFRDENVQSIQFLNLQVLSGQPLVQRMELKLTSTDFSLERKNILLTKIQLKHFKAKYEGP